MQNPRVQTGKGYIKRPRIDDNFDGCYYSEFEQDECLDEEEDYRNKLLEYEREKDKIPAKKGRALQALKVIDVQRADEAAKMKVTIEERVEEFRQKQREKEEAKISKLTPKNKNKQIP